MMDEVVVDGKDGRGRGIRKTHGCCTWYDKSTHSLDICLPSQLLWTSLSQSMSRPSTRLHSTWLPPTWHRFCLVVKKINKHSLLTWCYADHGWNTLCQPWTDRSGPRHVRSCPLFSLYFAVDAEIDFCLFPTLHRVCLHLRSDSHLSTSLSAASMDTRHGRACTNCVRAKAKCWPSTDSVENGKCERCIQDGLLDIVCYANEKM